MIGAGVGTVNGLGLVSGMCLTILIGAGVGTVNGTGLVGGMCLVIFWIGMDTLGGVAVSSRTLGSGPVADL